MYIQSTLRFPLVVSYIKMILPYLNVHTILITNPLHQITLYFFISIVIYFIIYYMLTTYNFTHTIILRLCPSLQHAHSLNDIMLGG